jgi:hypothetical protein
MNVIPEETNIRYRFSAWDKTNYNSTRIEEEVTLKVVSSGQTKAASCDFSGLSLADKITGSRKYTVGSNFDGITISTYVDGIDSLANKECANELYMAVVMQVSADQYEQVWSQDGYITAGTWI